MSCGYFRFDLSTASASRVDSILQSKTRPVPRTRSRSGKDVGRVVFVNVMTGYATAASELVRRFVGRASLCTDVGIIVARITRPIATGYATPGTGCRLLVRVCEGAQKVTFHHQYHFRRVTVGQFPIRRLAIKLQIVAAAAMILHVDHFKVLIICLECVTVSAGERLARGQVPDLFRIEMNVVRVFQV